TRSFAGLRISAAGSRSPFGACSRLLNASSSIPARASSFPKTWVWDEVLRWAQDFGSRLPLAPWGLLTPAKRLKFDSGPRLQLLPKSGWTRFFAVLRISAAGSRSPFGACSRLLNASSSIPARASNSFPNQVGRGPSLGSGFRQQAPARPLGCAGTKNPRPGDYQAGAGFF